MGLLPRRRILRIVLVLAALVVVAALLLQYAMEPQRASRFLLARVGNALGLEITATGVAEYRLRGTPTLVVRDVVAREPGAARPLLRADRILLSLPWSTVRARGAVLEATRIELDAPILDLPALQHWLDGRPPSRQERMPTLLEGIHIRNGVLDGGSWRLDDVQAELPSFAPGVSSPLRLRGVYRDPPVAFELSGPLRWAAGIWSVSPAQLAVRGRGEAASDPVPAIDARGGIAFGQTLALRMQGDIATWPDAWPALPEPLASSRSPMSFTLGYDGALDLSATASLQLQREATRFDGRFELPAVLSWFDAGSANPLPPIDGTLQTPRLDIAGAQLHGIEIGIKDGDGE
ncbi:MAG: hypothetical protein M3Y70_07375 [Pseudomonadota bacterium]|nr:hypothetical protein [Pseudomonadota bacterium]